MRDRGVIDGIRRGWEKSPTIRFFARFLGLAGLAAVLIAIAMAVRKKATAHATRRSSRTTGNSSSPRDDDDDDVACENSCLEGLSTSFDREGERAVWVLENAGSETSAVECAFVFCVGTSASVECYSGVLAQAARAGALVLVGDAFGESKHESKTKTKAKVDDITRWTQAAESCMATLRRQLAKRNSSGSSIRLCIAGHSGGAPITLWLSHRLATDREELLGATALSRVDLLLVHPGAVPSLNVPSSPHLGREGAPFRGWTVAGDVLPHASVTVVTGDFFPATHTSLRMSNFAGMLTHQGIGPTDFDKAPDGMVDTDAAYVVQQYDLAKSSAPAASAPRAQLLTFPYSHESSWLSPMTVYDELFRHFTTDGFEGVTARFSGRSVAAQSLLVSPAGHSYPTWGSREWKDAMGLHCQYSRKTSSEMALVGSAGHGSGRIKFHKGASLPVKHAFLVAASE